MVHESYSSMRSALYLLAVLVGLSFLILLLPLQDPLEIHLDQRLLSPGTLGYSWGSDELGRDLVSRVLHGLSTTLWVSVAALIASLVLGALLGGLAGFFVGTVFDRTLSWIINLILSLPFLLIMAAVLSILSPGLVKAYAVLAGIMWVQPARIIRGEVVRRRSLGYVLAARALGVSEWQILWRKLIPRALIPATAFSYSYLPEIIVLEAGLSFLGMGVQPPDPGLGKMIFDGLPHLYSAWWLAICPAAVLFIIILIINIFGIVQRRHTGTAWQ